MTKCSRGDGVAEVNQNTQPTNKRDTHKENIFTIQQTQDKITKEHRPTLRCTRSPRNMPDDHTGHRLSDFFPPIDALSPIVGTATRRSARIRATSTPSTTSKIDGLTKSRKKRTKKVPDTAVFDPDVHTPHSEAGVSSSEENFVKSLQFSAIKPKTTVQTGKMPESKGSHDYEVVVDYSSDSDGFVFSPVKLTPKLAKKVRIASSNVTPSSGDISDCIKKMVWNSDKKCVEEMVWKQSASTPVTRNLSKHRINTPAQPRLVTKIDTSLHHAGSRKGEKKNALLTNVRITASPHADAASDSDTTTDSDPHSVSEADSDVESDASTAMRNDSDNGQNSEESSISHNEYNKPGAIVSDTIEEPQEVMQASLRGKIGKESVVSTHLPSLTASPMLSARSNRYEDLRKARDENCTHKSTTRPRELLQNRVSARSPKVSLTRVISGTQNAPKLEQMAVPDEFYKRRADPAIRSKPKAKQRGRLLQGWPNTVPMPSNIASRVSRGMISELTPKTFEEPTQLETARRAVVSGAGPPTDPITISSCNTNRKRKASVSQSDREGIKSPAKRIKVSLPAPSRPIAPLRTKVGMSRAPVRQANAATSTQQPLRTKAAHSLLRGLSEEEINRPPMPHAGVVPHSLYSPEKLNAPQMSFSATKPAPFKFATAQRAIRSPVSTSKEVQSKASARKETHSKKARVVVPVLQAPPFIPRPSTHQATVAASPARKLPSRLAIRWEFDRVAEQHADQALQRRREEEAALAAERERRAEERKGWRDSGTAAIQQWAASRAKLTSDGKRDWVD